uniref:Uncharacterized protein n=1 Tax=Manihot esculenta TaxID=3983 RepID=A0A2C9V745_MANES
MAIFNELFDHIRNQILILDLLPTLNKVYKSICSH